MSQFTMPNWYTLFNSGQCCYQDQTFQDQDQEQDQTFQDQDQEQDHSFQDQDQDMAYSNKVNATTER